MISFDFTKTDLLQDSQAAYVQFISKEPVIVNGAFNNKYKTFLVRDPDGHALQISELIRE